MPKPLHPKRHTAALKIAATLHRLERIIARLNNAALSAAAKDLHDALADGVVEHGAEIGIGGDVAPFSGGIAK